VLFRSHFAKEEGYSKGRDLPTEVLVRVLDDTLTLVDNTLNIGYKKTTL
jgi:hypothetical protein